MAKRTSVHPPRPIYLPGKVCRLCSCGRKFSSYHCNFPYSASAANPHGCFLAIPVARPLQSSSPHRLLQSQFKANFDTGSMCLRIPLFFMVLESAQLVRTRAPEIRSNHARLQNSPPIIVQSSSGTHRVLVIFVAAAPKCNEVRKKSLRHSGEGYPD